MFRARSPFMTPTIPGTPKVNSKEQRRQMSLQPNEQQKPPKITNVQSSGLAINPQTVDEKFCLSLDIPTQQGFFWVYQMSSAVVGQYSRRLVFRQQYHFTKGLTQNDIRQTIYITAEGVPGYKDKNGSITNRVCALHLTNIDAVIDDTGMKTYDLLYKQTQDHAWQIPMHLGELRFGVSFDQVVQNSQLAIPIVCQFDIRHVGK